MSLIQLTSIEKFWIESLKAWIYVIEVPPDYIKVGDAVEIDGERKVVVGIDLPNVAASVKMRRLGRASIVVRNAAETKE